MIRHFLRSERGNVALETAFALVVLVSAFGALMHILGDAFAEDRAARAARAAAYALAIDPAADPWAALRREGGVEVGTTCPSWAATDTTASCGGWTLTVHRDVSPATLATVLGGGDATAGEMVLVVIGKELPQPARSAGVLSIPGGGTAIGAFGVARREPVE